MEKDNPTSFTDPNAAFTFIFDNPSPNSVNEVDRLAVYTNVQDGAYYNTDAESAVSQFLDPGRWTSGANWQSDSDSSAHHSPSGDDFSFDFRMSPSGTPLDSPLSPTSTTPEHQHQQQQISMTFPNSEAYGGFPESQAVTDALLRLSVQDPRDACLAPYLPESAVVGPSRLFEPEVDQPTFGFIDEVTRGSTLELEWILGENASPGRRFDAGGGGVISLSEIEGGRTRGRDSDAITKRRKMDASFKCPHCQVDFTTRIRLNGHIDSTHRGKRYQCTEQNCGKSYRHITSRDRHIENRHGKKR